MAASLVSLLLLLSLVSASAYPQIWNIDCGATEDWLETDTNLTWVADGDYVKSGVSREIASKTGVERSLTTLRSFPENRKNCYTIPVGAKTKVQVWVSFYYGNYDGLGKPPSLELLLDGNDWIQIDTEMDEQVDHTVVYTTERNSTNICFGRIDDQIPFVSSIQVVAFGSEMYSKVNSTVALYFPAQIAVGAPQFFRSPDDPYDRIWYPSEGNIITSTNNTVFTNATNVSTSTCPDNPPAKLFDIAVTPTPGGSRNLSITARYLSSVPDDVYLNMYFTELKATSGGKRMFDIYMDGELISNASSPIAPRVGEGMEFSCIASQVSNATIFTLAPTKNSTLPPIISGFETWYMYEFLSAGTNDADVNALAILQAKFKVLQNWSGDPCLPEDYNWEWVNCTSEESPRITILSLGGYGLSGSLPDFSGLDALESVDLHNNSLSGEVPGFLARFPKLKHLNLAYNNFSSVPSSLINNRKITVNMTGNPLLETNATPPSPPPSNPHTLKDGSDRVSSSAFIVILLALVITAVV